MIRGFSMRLRILECVTSLLNMTPFRTLQSSISPPGIFSTLAYLLMSTSFLPPTSTATRRTASRAICTSLSDQRLENFVPMVDSTSFVMRVGSRTSTSIAIFSQMRRASWRARL